jgi:hypothetical protein
MNDIELSAIEERCNKATPGPWTYIPDWGDVVSCAEESMCHIADIPTLDDRPDDMEFIANARADIPALIAEIRRLRAEIDKLKANTRLSWDDDADSGF